MLNARSHLNISDLPLTTRNSKGEYEVNYNGNRMSLNAWADGYRLFFQWFLDLHLAALDNEVSNRICGILLIDELELHLHPQLQATILDRLSKAFPSLLLIATTHSPLVTLSTKAENLIVLTQDGDEIKSVEPPSLEELTVEDVVTDPRLFNASPYSPERQEKLSKWRRLMNIPPDEISAKDSEELAKLTDELLSA